MFHVIACEVILANCDASFPDKHAIHSDMVHVIHTDDEMITTELLKRRDADDTGLKSEYFVRKIRVPTSDRDEEIPRSELALLVACCGARVRSGAVARSSKHTLPRGEEAQRIASAYRQVFISEPSRVTCR